MLKDVTLGRYYSVDSLIHKIDPRTKIRFTIIYIILLLLDRNLPFYLLMSAVFVGVLLASMVPISYIVRGTKSILAVIIVCSAINIFTTMGDTLLMVGPLKITDAGLVKFGFVIWRMVLIILVSSMLMYTTKPIKLADGLEKCFRLSAGVAMGITIALRFISVLFEELDRIMMAQQARGACFNEGGVLKRTRSLKPVIVPLFQNSIDRAKNLGEALDARCYKGGKERTKLEPLKYKKIDALAYLLMIAMTIAAIWLIFKF